MTRRRKGVQQDPYTTERPSPLELFARLMVSSSYRVPVVGRGTKPGLQPHDIAAAAGMMRGLRLQRETALMVALRAEAAAIARVADQAYLTCEQVVRHSRVQGFDLAIPANRWRLRMVIIEAAYEMTHPSRRQPYGA